MFFACPVVDSYRTNRRGQECQNEGKLGREEHGDIKVRVSYYDWMVQESKDGSDSRWWMTGNKFKEKKHKREFQHNLEALLSSYLCSRPSLRTSPTRNVT